MNYKSILNRNILPIKSKDRSDLSIAITEHTKDANRLLVEELNGISIGVYDWNEVYWEHLESNFDVIWWSEFILAQICGVANVLFDQEEKGKPRIFIKNTYDSMVERIASNHPSHAWKVPDFDYLLLARKNWGEDYREIVFDDLREDFYTEDDDYGIFLDTVKIDVHYDNWDVQNMAEVVKRSWCWNNNIIIADYPAGKVLVYKSNYTKRANSISPFLATHVKHTPAKKSVLTYALPPDIVQDARDAGEELYA